MKSQFIGTMTCAAMLALLAIGCTAENKTFTGTLSMDGAPLENAGVQLYPKDSNAKGVHYATTDAQGAYKIAEDSANPLTPGEYIVVVDKVPTEMGGKSVVVDLYRDKASSPLTIQVSGDSTTLPPTELSSKPKS